MGSACGTEKGRDGESSQELEEVVVPNEAREVRSVEHHRSDSNSTPPLAAGVAAGSGAHTPSAGARRERRWTSEGSVISSETRRRRRAESVTFDLSGQAKAPIMSVAMGAILMLLFIAVPMITLAMISRRTPQSAGNLDAPPSPQQVRDVLHDIVVERLAAQRAQAELDGKALAANGGSDGATEPSHSGTTSGLRAESEASSVTAPHASQPLSAPSTAHAQLEEWPGLHSPAGLNAEQQPEAHQPVV